MTCERGEGSDLLTLILVPTLGLVTSKEGGKRLNLFAWSAVAGVMY